MTQINRLSIHGFKSFAHKTEIPFDQKFNVILGPNGAGKSNISDALCFVLGRLSAKSMRAEKAANLIFNGGKSKTPASSAMVEIVFDNHSKVFPENAPEIMISRTITKDGGSIYRINGKKKTRTEVIDTLAVAKINPEGYNIILQGDITRFVDMHPLERRKIIEEISDVSIYEEKKHKTLLELQNVEEKMNNAELILKERKVYLQELKKDRDQALKFKELKDKIDSTKATLVHLQLKEREELQAKYQQEFDQQQKKIKAAEEAMLSLKKKNEESKSHIQQINREIEQKGEKEQLQVHKTIEDLKVTLAQEKARSSTLKDEINKIQQRKDQFRGEIQELKEKTSVVSQEQRELQGKKQKLEKELKEWEEKIAQFKKKNKIETSQELEKEIEKKDQLIEKIQEEAQQLRQKQQDLLREKDQAQYQLQTLDERIKKVREVEQQNKQQLQELQGKKSAFKQLTLKLTQVLDQDSSFASQLANARKRLMELQETETKLQAKSSALQASLSGNRAVKSILENKKKWRGVYGTVAELGKVQKKYALPLNVAAGNKMQNIVVDNDQTAAECIAFLKNNKMGTASFIPLNKIKSKDISTEDKKWLKREGVHDFALNLISFDARFSKAFEYVFMNTLVVENIEVARKIGIGSIKMATLDGNLAELSGVMRGGFIALNLGTGFQEQNSLEELGSAAKALEEQQKIVSNLEVKRSANEQEISSLRNHRAELEAESIKLEKSLHLEDADLNASNELKKELTANVKEADTALAELHKKISQRNQELVRLKSEKQGLRSQVSQLRDPSLLAQLTAFEQARQKCREDIMGIDSGIKTSSAQLQQMFTPEMQKIQEIIKQHDKEEAKFTAEIKQLAAVIKEREQELTQKEKDSKEFYSKYRELFNRREKLNAEISKAENEIETMREKSRGSEREANLISLKNAEVKARLAALRDEFSRYKNAEILKNKTPQELQQEIGKFESMMTQMSAVNMKALEVYDQVEKEYSSLVEKKESLEKEKTEVLTLMNEIETKKKDHFMKTFSQANDNFQRIFSTLFKKGKAYLQLDNAAHPFDDGLSVKVKLSGNRYLDIKSLSGGEKTLTALSFIFAIQEYQPSSFYILDEVDASLDKHNSELLAKLVRDYAHNAQYIVISHNDSFITEADSLYGISMNEGVSKVTSLKI